MSPSLSPDEHRRLVESLGRTLAPRAVPLSRALGCVLAEPLAARLPVPPFTNSAMDRFAVHASDLAELPATVLGLVQPDDVVITMGAGSIGTIPAQIVARMSATTPSRQGAEHE